MNQPSITSKILASAFSLIGLLVFIFVAYQYFSYLPTSNQQAAVVSSASFAPTNLHPSSGSVFPSSTNNVIISWNSVPGVGGYLLRARDLTDSTLHDPRNSAHNQNYYLYIDNYNSTFISLPVISGHSYFFYVYAVKVLNGVNTKVSDPTVTSFSVSSQANNQQSQQNQQTQNQQTQNQQTQNQQTNTLAPNAPCSQLSPAIVPFQGIYLLGPGGVGNPFEDRFGTLDKTYQPYIEGFASRAEWRDFDFGTSAPNYQFDSIVSPLTLLQTNGKKLSLQIDAEFVPDYVRDTAGQTYNAIASGDRSETTVVPWDDASLAKYNAFMTAFANYQVLDVNRGCTVPLKDHPALGAIRIGPLGIGRLQQDSLSLIVAAPNYSRANILKGLNTSLQTATNAFPNTYMWVQYFSITDGNAGQTTLNEDVLNAMASFKFNSDPTKTQVGMFSSSLFGDAPGRNGPAGAQYINGVNRGTFMTFQACDSWVTHFLNCHPTPADIFPANGMSLGYGTFGARYYELYVGDLYSGDQAITNSLQTWDNYLKNPTTAPSPMVLQTSVSGSTVNLTWNNTNNLGTAVKVESSNSTNGPWTAAPILGGSAVNYSYTNQNPGTYYYRVHGYEDLGAGGFIGDYEYSNTASAVVTGGGGGDVTPPTISLVSAASVNPTNELITWHTNELATSQVQYGLTTAYGNISTKNSNIVLDHSVSLTGLLSNTLYHYKVISNDSSNNTSTSSDQTFQTSTQLYPLTITKSGTGSGTITSSPSGINCGSTCIFSFNSGTVVTLSASSNVGSAFTGWTSGGCSGNGNCVITLNSTTTVNANFNITTDTIPPSVNITTPSNGAIVVGSISISANASDNVAVSNVQFQIDGANIGSQDSTSPYSVTWNSTTIANGTHTVKAIATDTSGNQTTSATIAVTVSNVDSQPPTVSMTAPTNGSIVSGNSVTVSAIAADNVGVLGVQFKLDGVNLLSEDTTSPYGIVWNTTSVSNGSHTLTAVARDAAGHTTTSSGITVTVSNSDITPPTVSITTPSNGAIVAGSAITISANASDNVGVSGVQFQIDGVNLGIQDTTSPYGIIWDTTTVLNGIHTIKATATDTSGNQSSASITVTISNQDLTPPTVSITTPLNNAIVSGNSVSITATAADNIGVVGVQFKLNGANLSSEDLISPYGIVWDSTTVSNGVYTVTATARDAAGNTKISSSVTFTVSNSDITAPTVSITTPSNGATVSGTVFVSGTASDNIGVVGVQFKLDNVNLNGEDLISPYGINWDTTQSINGSHTLNAVARDLAGNTKTSTAVAVTVSNQDLTPPTISNIISSSITTSGAIIGWSTNELSDSQVQYGLNAAYGSFSSLNPTLTLSHSITLSSLSPNTTYHYAVISKDPSGNKSVSSDKTFTTLIQNPTTAILTVIPTGLGTVTSNVGGINCLPTCATTLTSGTPVTLTAVPGSGYKFTGWTGGGCTGNGVCSFTLNVDTTITGVFDIIGGGSGGGGNPPPPPPDNEPPPATLPPGCSPGDLFSAITGLPCNGTIPPTNLPPGCLPGYLFSQITGLPCGTSSTLPPVGSYVFTRDLSFGSQGDDVVALQNILIAKGYLAEGLNIGIFGSRTTAALTVYQLANGISPALGYFGPLTRASLNGSSTTLPPVIPPVIPPSTIPPTGSYRFTLPLYNGSSGPEVVALQNYLISKGYLAPGFNTGYFGSLTEDAVGRFQIATGIFHSSYDDGYGLVGPMTRTKLNE